MAGSPVPGIALSQVDVRRERRPARILKLPHRLRQAGRAVRPVQVAQALHDALHRAGADPEAHPVLQVGQHVVPPLEERLVVAGDRAALAVHHGGVGLAEEVLVAVPHEAAVQLQRGREGAGADQAELADRTLHAGGAVAGAQVVPALVEAVSGHAGGRTGVVAGGVAVVGRQRRPGDEGGEEGVEVVLEGGDGIVLVRRAAGVDEGGSFGGLLGGARQEEESPVEEEAGHTELHEEHVAL
ncbi:hypothetical protein B296_00047400 [Ensete ventricosum]|uniref:Uncharacterized protein n=1 Tax=Ensete ventricosum TaxID=4639 RepID=A0A426XYT1_ENSVE|nr:hypothetical protein B296_00047400 [Ensete ventricosum]